jgi:hypothetical protein
VTHTRAGTPEAELLRPFLEACREAARAASVSCKRIDAHYATVVNPRHRDAMDGHSPELRCLSEVHVEAVCAFRVPLAKLAEGARLARDGDDWEVLLAGQEPGQGELVGEYVVLEEAALIESLILPGGLAAFAAEHLETQRGWSDLRPKFTCSRPAFELRRNGACGELWLTFTAEMST